VNSDGVAIVWFRRDLRLADNPALAAACERSRRLVLLYVHAPEEEGDWQPGGASRWWLHHSLARLSQSLRARGAELQIRRGPTLPALLDVARETGAASVFWNRLYEPMIAARDQRVASGLREAGLGAESFNAALLVEPWESRSAQGGPYRVFTPFWRSCLKLLDAQPRPLPAPKALAAAPVVGSGLSLDELELLPKTRWDWGLRSAWTPGEEGALRRLELFCETALSAYETGRNRPDRPDTSRISPHLHFGEVGPRQCLAAVRNAALDQPAARTAADSFLREIGWREFAHHLLHHFPRTATEPLDERFAHFPWEPNPAWLDAWQRGCTGYPIVDAGMRELWSTGWMHNRVRMIVASLLTKNLRQPWLDGARWFWDTLVDADLASNTLGWQWTAGCGADAAPYFRIFNPALQAARHDPDGGYVRRWLPEPMHDYPPPIVDFRESRAAALAAYARIKGGARRPAT
jgi:deoxyribodipyrimidine photo-lyase